MKTLVQFLIQIPLLLWLLWWASWALLIVPNQYEGSSIFVPDCDTDGEALILLSMWIIWLTTALMMGFSICIRFWRRAKTLWGINTVAVLISMVSIVRYMNLVAYSEQLQQYCK